MRRLMWFAIGFGAACAMGAYLSPGFAVLMGAGGVLAAISVLVLLSKRIRWVGCVCLGLALGLLWFGGFDSLFLGPARQADGEIREIALAVTDAPMETDRGGVVWGTATLQGRRYKTQLYLNSREALPELGDVLVLNARLRLTTGGKESATSHGGDGIFLLAYQTGSVTVRPGAADTIWILPARWRGKLIDLLNRAFPQDTAGFARALLLGDTSGIDYETDTALKVSGIRHIIAVSGLHISILFSLLRFICGKRRMLTVLTAAPALIFFAAIAGFTPSVTRACVMQLLMLLALLLEREYDPPTELAFSALVMLAWNPWVITSVSFQLSFGCIAGIFLCSPRIRSWMLSDRCLGAAKGRRLSARLKRWLAGSVSVTLGAMVLTTPLCAYYFGMVSLVGVVTNLLTLPVVTAVFYGVVLVCGAGLLWMPAARLMAWVISWGMRYVTAVAKALASLPLAAVYTESNYIVFWLVFCYILLAVFLLSKKRRPVVLALCGSLGLCAALLASWLEPLGYECAMTVLDVGQGQCILLQSEGKNYLVDCGGDSDAYTANQAAALLLSQGISRLDGLILTHYDRDHSGGVEKLLTRVRADVVFLPEAADEYGVGADIGARAETVRVGARLVLSAGELVVTIYPPALSGRGNDGSLAVLFQTESCGILITGDRGSFGERRLVEAGIPPVDVLIVGHHGSASSTCPELLAAAAPETAVISVSADNPYGHPRQEVLDRLTEAGCEIYRTDQNGTIQYRR